VRKAIRWSRMVDDAAVGWTASNGTTTSAGMAWRCSPPCRMPPLQAGLAMPASPADPGLLPLALLQDVRSCGGGSPPGPCLTIARAHPCP
jgi:hypothetical protein